MAKVSTQAVQKLSDELKKLTDSTDKYHKSFRGYMRLFAHFTKTSKAFFDSYQGGNPNNPGNPGNPNNPGNNGPEDDEKARKRGPFAWFEKSAYKLWGTIQQMDDLQARALGSNTTLQKLNIPQLGIRFSKLANEILDLREQGIRDLSVNTLKLMSTMKLTNQNTASLKEFIAKTSLELKLNTKQAQSLTEDFSKYSVRYGMTQETLLKIANDISKVIQPANILGKGAEVTKGLALVAAQIGDRATEDLKKAAQLLTGIGNETELMTAGIFNISNKFISARAEEQAQMMKAAVTQFMNSWRRTTQGLGAGTQTDRRALAQYAEMFGGMDMVNSMQNMELAYKEAAVATNENNQGLTTMKTIQEKYNDQMERVANTLQSILLKLPNNVATGAGTAAGGLATVAAGAGTGIMAAGAIRGVGSILGFVAKRAATTAVTSMWGGPWGAAIGGAIGLGLAIWDLKDLWKSSADSGKDTSENTAIMAEIAKKESEQTTRSSVSLIDTINSMLSMVGPAEDTYNKDSLGYMQESVNQMREMNLNLQRLMQGGATAPVVDRER